MAVGCQEEEPQQTNNNTNPCVNDTEPPLIDIQGSSSAGTPGTIIQFTTTATNDHEVKLAKVDGTITYNDGSGLLKTEDIGIIYIDTTTLSTAVNGSFSYTVPATVGSHALGSHIDDYIEFVAHVEDCYGTMTSNFPFNVNQ